MQNKSLNNKVLVSLLAMSCVYMGGDLCLSCG